MDLSDDMKDRYIYMFNDGRLTSGLFQCFNISDDEYVYGIKRLLCYRTFKRKYYLHLKTLRIILINLRKKLIIQEKKKK